MKKKLLFSLFVIIVFSSLPAKSYSQEAFTAEVKLFAGNFAPRGWAFCEGQILPISQNQALFSLVGTMYGGDGRTNFALPDLRGRVPVGVGNGPGLSQVNIGQKQGAESVSLNANQLPSHKHGLEKVAEIEIKDSQGNKTSDSKKVLSPVTSGGSTTVTTTNTGGSQAISIKPPSLGMRYIICINGIFPSRS